MKIIGVHHGPHRLHYAWMKSVCENIYPFVPRWLGPHPSIKDKIHITNKFFKINVIQQLFAIYQSFFIPKADIYLVESVSSLLPAILNKRKGTKILMINSNIFFYDYDRANWLMKKINARYLKHVDGIISSSHMIRNKCQQYIKTPNLIVYPFFEGKFKYVTADIKSKNICYVGRFSGEKHIDLVLKIFSLIKPENKDKLYLIGCPKHQLEQFSDIPGVVPIAWTTEVEKYVKKCGLYLHMGGPDAFGLSVIEAMATGMPAIVTTLCGAQEAVSMVSKDFVVGFEPKQVAKLIDSINSNQKRKLQLGKKARKVALKEFNEEKSIKNFQDTIHKLISTID